MAVSTTIEDRKLQETSRRSKESTKPEAKDNWKKKGLGSRKRSIKGNAKVVEKETKNRLTRGEEKQEAGVFFFGTTRRTHDERIREGSSGGEHRKDE